MKGVILDVQSDHESNRLYTYIRVTLYDENRTFVLTDKEFRPYFYVIVPSDKTIRDVESRVRELSRTSGKAYIEESKQMVLKDCGKQIQLKASVKKLMKI